MSIKMQQLVEEALESVSNGSTFLSLCFRLLDTLHLHTSLIDYFWTIEIVEGEDFIQKHVTKPMCVQKIHITPGKHVLWSLHTCTVHVAQ